MEEESQPTKTHSFPIVTILGIIIVTAILVGGGIYLWVQNQEKEGQTSTQNQNISTSSRMVELPRPVSPTNVTENFILATLGTVPGALINYDEAKTLLSEKLKAEFTQDTFIPEFYGIQQGPDSYEMKTETISNATASVKIDVKYGSMMEAWAFVLVKEAGEWKINELRKDAQ